MNKINTKFIYLIIIIFGSIFVLIPCFHNNLWFDEAYSVCISSFNFDEIWSIGSHDVHPILYYFLLHIIYIIFNGNIIFLRLFSCIPLIIMSILGYTHIRKDFDNKIGLIFSFLSLFMPVCLVFSGEIRMYTWSMLFVTIMSIYAYRIYKNSSTKNWIIFSVFSLFSAYTHYYALVVAFIENALLFGYFIYKKIKKQDSKNLLKSIISAVIQILLYIPWIGAFISQATSVSHGFWIDKPDLWSILIFQFTGNLMEISMLSEHLAIIFSLIGSIFVLIMLIKHIKEHKAVQASIFIYVTVIIILWIVSVIVQPILYSRYFLNLTGLFLFVLAFCISKMSNKICIIICSFIIIVSSIINVNLINSNYSKSNFEPFDYISNELQPNDILLYNNDGARIYYTFEIKI